MPYFRLNVISFCCIVLLVLFICTHTHHSRIDSWKHSMADGVIRKENDSTLNIYWNAFTGQINTGGLVQESSGRGCVYHFSTTV